MEERCFRSAVILQSQQAQPHQQDEVSGLYLMGYDGYVTRSSYHKVSVSYEQFMKLAGGVKLFLFVVLVEDALRLNDY